MTRSDRNHNHAQLHGQVARADAQGIPAGVEDTAVYERNIERISAYLQAGEALASRRHLGLEVEHFIVDAASMELVPYCRADAGADAADDTRPGVEDLLHMLEPLYEGEVHTIDARGHERIIGLRRPGAPLSLEPGAQLEVSIGPACNVADLREAYMRFRSEVHGLIEPLGYTLVALGYHPSACAADIPLIPKHRYAMMNRYFEHTGKHGICMMRGSASTQVSIDFTDEADCIDKMRIATQIGPLLYFLTDNAPIFEGQRVDQRDSQGRPAVSKTGLQVPARMARAQIWNDVDPDRSMCAGFLFEPGAGYASYARMLMNRPLILTLDDPADDNTAVYHGSTPAAVIYDGHELSQAEIEHVLSMFFFDVRLKQYIEIRMPDSLPMDYALSFAALVKGIFYHDEALDTLRGMLQGVGAAQVAQAKAALARDGYAADVYGRQAAEWLDTIIGLAHEGLGKPDGIVRDDGSCTPAAAEQGFLQPLANLVATRTSLLDRILGGETID